MSRVNQCDDNFYDECYGLDTGPVALPRTGSCTPIDQIVCKSITGESVGYVG